MKTTTSNKVKGAPAKERLAYLEEAYRHTLESLEMAATLGMIEGESPPRTVIQVLRETASRLRGLLKFKAQAFFLVREPGGEFHLARCHPPAMAARMTQEMRLLVENGSAAWALRRNRPVFTSISLPDAPDGAGGQLLLHAMSTASRIRGMFLGLTTQDTRTITDASLALLTIVLRSGASLMEGLELYGLLREANVALTAKVRDLEESKRSLTREIERRRKMEEILKHQTLHDPLTGLPNQTLMRDHIRQAINRARRRHDFHYAAAFLDLDRFKLVNDTLGHDAGDHLLVQVARRLQDCVRRLDTVARFGGDEFVIFLEDLGSPDEALRVMDRVLSSLHSPFDINGHSPRVTGSIGLAFGDLGVNTPERLIKNADAALRQAKKAGRDRIEVFSAGLRRKPSQEAAHATELHRDLTSGPPDPTGGSGRTGALYLPALSTEDMRLKGFVAIPVWTAGDGNVVKGEELTRLAALAGVGRKLWQATLQKALGDMRAWRDGSGIFSSLAVSLVLWPLQLFPAQATAGEDLAEGTGPVGPRDKDEWAGLAETVRSALEQAGLPGEALHLDVSEQSLEYGGEDLTGQLARLKGIGVRLCVGGFGERLFTMPAGRPRFPEGLEGGPAGRPASDFVPAHPGDAHAPPDALTALARALNVPLETVAPDDARGTISVKGPEILPGLQAEGALSRPLTEEEARELMRSAGNATPKAAGENAATPEKGTKR